jgi:uroporphyrin-III C-methyltransferase
MPQLLVILRIFLRITLIIYVVYVKYLRMTPSKRSHLVLAGAGPGDPELITVKALRAIEWAEVILYDALVNIDLLQYARKECKLVYVGKRKGQQEYSQDEINQLLVVYACRYSKVLRLKGGDPFVFGRGHEELEYARERGIYVEVIPGISSAIAAPASVGIPVTKRGVNESFWVITGMLANGNFSADMELAARSSASVVILMGMTHIQSIMNLFAKHRSLSEPVAVIQHATLPNQSLITGTSGSIVSLVEEHGITSPAVIVVGNVVREGTALEILSKEEVKMKVAV